MAKKLMINCAICDARKAQAEHYADYENITVNAATMLVNEAGKALLHKLPFTLNCSDVMELEGDVEVRTINGAGEIKAGDAVKAKSNVALETNSSARTPKSKYCVLLMPVRRIFFA